MNRKDTGFTLIEAMIVLSIAAMLLTVGLPAFASAMQRHRVTATLHLLAADMAMARGSAVVQGKQVVVCPRTESNRCGAASDWGRGWLVFTDADGNRQPDIAADILRSADAPGRGGRLSVISSRPFLRYQVDGRSAHSNLTVHVCADGQLAGQVVVNNHGRARTSRPKSPAACPGG
ncbi:GspH/FimT family pseudopilin [Luteimonas marina]|nr:GspH/FimT family pseudopilin [Luteimonas marina]